MGFKPLEPVVLLRDLPEHDLKSGDLDAVAEVYPSDTLDVEFVLAAGRTKALVTLPASAFRAIQGSDLIAVRSTGPTT